MGINSARRRVARRAGGSAVALGALLGAAVVLAPAASATDSESPSIDAQPWAAFVVDSQISTGTPDPDGNFFSRVQRSFSWTGSDNSGTICDNIVNEELAGGPNQQIAEGADLHSVVDTATDYDDQFGGGSLKVEDWQTTVSDCSGNSAYGYTRGSKPRVTQDNNTDGAWGVTDASIVYSKRWWTNTRASASGGTMHETGHGGATATITATFAAGQHFGLVMARGPRDGTAAVYVDGAPFADLDTYAARWRPRVVVYDLTMSAGTHTIRLVNRATAGHPHLQLDAVLTDD
jgi:hypothetical protein